MRHKGLRPTEKMLLSGLFEWWNEKGQHDWFYASNQQLAAFCGISEPSLIKARKRLVAAKWIEVQIGRPRAKAIDRMASFYHLSSTLKQTVSNTPVALNTLPLNTSTLVIGKVL